MTRTLWLHCGSFKSGSSRIQHEAWTRREELLGRGWLYPRAGLVLDEPDVGVRHSHLVYLARDPEVWQGMVDELVAEVAASPAPHVLMSSEAWSRPGKGEVLAAMLAALREAGVVDEVHAVLYLRNRFTYARSLFRELTRRRDNVLPLAGFVEATPRPLDPLDTVRALRTAVAPGDLQVFPYEEVGDTAAHFFGLLGLDVAAGDPWANRGLTAPEVEAHRQLNLLAPALRDDFPGLAAVLPPEVAVDPAAYAERFGDGQLAAPAPWRAELREATGWTEAQVDALLAAPEVEGRDVTTLGPLLHGVVRRWLEETCEERVEVTTHPAAGVADLTVDPVEPVDGWFRVGGCLLPAKRTGPLRLLALDDTGERELVTGRPSPAFARRHPRRSEAATARFALPRATLGAGGRLDLVVEQGSGERSVVASLRRQWVRREPPG